MQITTREQLHGYLAVEIGKLQGIFDDECESWDVVMLRGSKATEADYQCLKRWQDAMDKDVAMLNNAREMDIDERITDVGSVEALASVHERGAVEVYPTSLTGPSVGEETLVGVNPDELRIDQRRAYDIIDWHLQQTMAGHQIPQLLMIIPGEGGVGKSKTIQTITSNFKARGVDHFLAKGAYTGIAASVIDGKTLHVLAGINPKGGKHSARGLKKLAMYWTDKRYLIIDEISMVSREFFAKIAKIIGTAKTRPGQLNCDRPFGGLNVVLVGDFHQFPPVIGKKSAPLYWPSNAAKDSLQEIIGRQLYEQFTIVVRLKEQIRVIDPVWSNLLQHVRYGTCRKEHLRTLRDLIITNPNCPATNFNEDPWRNAVLITPRHAVRTQWNTAASVKASSCNKTQLFISQAYDTCDGKPLTLREQHAVMIKSGDKGKNREERAGLSNAVELAIGMKVMVTINVVTDLDVANGSRGEIVDILLDERETENDSTNSIVRLQYPPCYVLVKLSRTKAKRLCGLPEQVIPIVPVSKTFTIDMEDRKETITRLQLPMTPAYAFTDYRSQGQTINPVVIDIGPPPSGGLTPFNAYVALSRGQSRDSIRLLRDFDDKLFTQHPSEYLRIEDERLIELDKQTKEWWEKMRSNRGGSK